MKYARPMPLPSFPYGMASQGCFIQPHIVQSTGPQKHLHATAARCRGRAGVDWPMGLYDELPKLTSKDVHIGRLPTDNSEKLVDIQRTMRMPRGGARYHGEAFQPLLGPHDGRGTATKPKDRPMRTMCIKSDTYQGARWDSGPMGGLIGAINSEREGSPNPLGMSFSMDSIGASTMPLPHFGDTGKLIAGSPHPSGRNRSSQSRARSTIPQGSHRVRAPSYRPSSEAGHQTVAGTPKNHARSLPGPRVCVPGMEGLSTTATMQCTKWDELIATKARRNTLGADRTAWQLMESNFEVEAREDREKNAMDHAVHQVRRASVAQAVDGIPECIPGLMKRRNSVGDNGESSFFGRRGSLGHALGELAQIEEQQRQQREGAKPRRGRVIRGIQEKIAFGQKSALYGRGLFNEGLMKS